MEITLTHRDGSIRIVRPTEMFSQKLYEKEQYEEKLLKFAKDMGGVRSLVCNVNNEIGTIKLDVFVPEETAPEQEITPMLLKRWKQRRITKVKNHRKELVNRSFTMVSNLSGVTRVLNDIKIQRKQIRKSKTILV